MIEPGREAGILLPVTALPSDFGIGCFSRAAYEFVDFLRDCGQRYWQILPLSPTSFGDSPYQSFSGFAGNPYLIDLDCLIDEGLLSEAECVEALGERGQGGAVDYRLQYQRRYPLLRLAYSRWNGRASEALLAFEREMGEWLEDYALFMALKERHGGAPWQEWEEPLRLREEQALAECRRECSEEIGFWKFLQLYFFKGWWELKAYAKERGIQIIGDLPIYVAADSADVWVHPELFLLDKDRRPLRVAGCPPDGFTPKGQLWGNPLYRWEEHRRSDYAWWIARLGHGFSMYDVIRIDHFRGFDSYYSIPFGAPDAVEGRWEEGIGDELFRVVEEILGKREMIAEDLGYMTESVRELVRRCGFPGMKILQFGFDPTDRTFSGEYLPHNYPEHCVAYTGTHDNPTLAQWLAECSPEERSMVREYLWDFYTPDEELSSTLIACLMRSPAELCVVPLQDYLALGAEARMNTPSTAEGNWQWRVRRDALSEELKQKITRLCRVGGREGRD